MQTSKPEEWQSSSETRKSRGSCLATSCLGGIVGIIILPIIVLFTPFPEEPFTAYPVDGKSSFAVLQHKMILSLGLFDQYDQNEYVMRRYFWMRVDAPGDQSGKSAVTLQCIKLEYRMNDGEWRAAERASEGDYNKNRSVKIWYWSPHKNDLDTIDVSRESYKMRLGTYDIRAVFENADGAREVIETKLTLTEKSVRKWTSVAKILKGLSGIN
jgi:hypothetical protein